MRCLIQAKSESVKHIEASFLSFYCRILPHSVHSIAPFFAKHKPPHHI